MKKAASKPKVATDQPLGQQLRRRRLDKGLTLEDVATETRIQKTAIKAIENTNYQVLPHTPHTLGFIKRYARLLGMNEQTAIQRYLTERGPLQTMPHRRPVQTVKNPIIGSRLLGWLTGSALLALVSGYLAWQLSILTYPPRLSLDQPADNQQTDSPSLEIKGKTTPGSEVKVNGRIVYVDEGGVFAIELILNPGVNVIRAEATNRRHQTSLVERSVLYQPTS